MYTRPEVQGQGIGGRSSIAIVATARAEGIGRLVLETGDAPSSPHGASMSAPASAAAAPFSTIPIRRYSVFYEKRLASDRLQSA